VVRDQPLGGGAGEGEPEVLLEEALLYWLLAARTGHPQACLALGVAFAEGVCGLRADLELGVKLQDLALLLWWQVRARGDEGGGGSALEHSSIMSPGCAEVLQFIGGLFFRLVLGVSSWRSQLFCVFCSSVFSALF
jgi:hypothetical protein